MAKQRYINTKIWRDSYIEKLDPSEKLLFIYLLTNPDTNICGIYEIPLKIIAIDVGFTIERTQKILTRFEKDNKIKYQDGWIGIKNFMSHQSISPKIKRGIEIEIEKTPPYMVSWVDVPQEIEYIYPMQEVSHSNTNTNTNVNTNINTKEPKGSLAPKNEYTPETHIIFNALKAFREKQGTFKTMSAGQAIGFNKGKKEIARLVELDDPQLVACVFNWAYKDSFWSGQPLTVEKYSSLKGQYLNKNNKSSNSETQDERVKRIAKNYMENQNG